MLARHQVVLLLLLLLLLMLMLLLLLRCLLCLLLWRDHTVQRVALGMLLLLLHLRLALLMLHMRLQLLHHVDLHLRRRKLRNLLRRGHLHMLLGCLLRKRVKMPAALALRHRRCRVHWMDLLGHLLLTLRGHLLRHLPLSLCRRMVLLLLLLLLVRHGRQHAYMSHAGRQVEALHARRPHPHGQGRVRQKGLILESKGQGRVSVFCVDIHIGGWLSSRSPGFVGSSCCGSLVLGTLPTTTSPAAARPFSLASCWLRGGGRRTRGRDGRRPRRRLHHGRNRRRMSDRTCKCVALPVKARSHVRIR